MFSAPNIPTAMHVVLFLIALLFVFFVPDPYRNVAVKQRENAGGRCRIRTYDFHRVKMALYR